MWEKSQGYRAFFVRTLQNSEACEWFKTTCLIFAFWRFLPFYQKSSEKIVKYSIFTNPAEWGIITTDDKSRPSDTSISWCSPPLCRALGAAERHLPASPSWPDCGAPQGAVPVPSSGRHRLFRRSRRLFLVFKIFWNIIKILEKGVDFSENVW